MIPLLKRGFREMKTIEESIQADFDIYAKKQRPYLQKKQKIRKFSHLNTDEKIVYSVFGFLLGIFFLIFLKPVFVGMNIEYLISFLVFTYFLSPCLFIFLEKRLFPIKGKRLERKILRDFYLKEISDDVRNTLKIRLSMDEYKYFFVNYGTYPTYGNLKSFLSERETLLSQFKAAEESKLSIALTTQEIVEYQEINLTK